MTVTGCQSFKPVSTMSDNQLKHEYFDIQHRISIKELDYLDSQNRMPVQPSYTTRGTANTYGDTTYINTRTTTNSGLISGYNKGLAIRGRRAIRDIKKLKSRLYTLRLELSRRGLHP